MTQKRDTNKNTTDKRDTPPFKLHYCIDDAVFYQKQWHIQFVMPDGKQFECSSPSQEQVVRTVNEQIRYELQRMDAMTLYVTAVDALLDLAIHHDGSGSKAAAQVLLSAFNSYCWQLAVVDLCNLDEINLEHAMAVLRGRVLCMREPHNIVENGDARFSELKECWPELHAEQRFEPMFRDSRR